MTPKYPPNVSQTGQGPDAPTTRYAHNALGQRVFKTEPLYAAASSKDGALDDEEEDPGLLQTLVDFFTKLWNPAKSDAEHLGWAYLYDEDGSLLGEYGMGGAQSAGQSQYIYLPTAQGPIPMAAEIDNRLYAIHTDHLGTPRRLTQADGQAAWQWAYTPYGDEAPTLGAKRFTNETTNPSTGSTGIAPVRFNLRYPGQYFDEESGLHYNYFRSYNPATGRYTQSDPIGLDGGWNRFGYVGGNPLGLADPKGLVTWSGSVTGGGVIDGIGGAGFIFDLTSECKCGKKVRIKGYASTVAGGLGVKYSGNSASANFFDPFDCPDGTRANGSFAAFSITSVVGGGFSWGAMRIGYLRSGWPSLTDSVVGFDISAGIYIGASVVTEMQIIPCESCEGK